MAARKTGTGFRTLCTRQLWVLPFDLGGVVFGKEDVHKYLGYKTKAANDTYQTEINVFSV